MERHMVTMWRSSYLKFKENESVKEAYTKYAFMIRAGGWCVGWWTGGPWGHMLEPRHWVMRVRSLYCLFQNQTQTRQLPLPDSSYFILVSKVKEKFIMAFKKIAVLRVQGTHLERPWKTLWMSPWWKYILLCVWQCICFAEFCATKNIAKELHKWKFVPETPWIISNLHY